MADYDNADAGFDGERSYERRDRSASPRGDREDRDDRPRERSPNGRAPAAPADKRVADVQDEDGATNTGTNLFVTGIHPRLSEVDVTALFDKYGEVDSCSIMLDPHTKESRGFGFVKMATAEQADAAREGLQGAQIEGRTLSIEKARRGRPRQPTPGKYFGPPKREGDFRGGRGGGYRDRYDDRRGGYGGGSYGGGYGRRDDYRSGPPRRYDEDRGYGGGYRRDRDDNYSGGRIDRYESSRRGGDEYRSSGSDRRGGYGYDRADDRSGGDRGYSSGAPRDAAPRDDSYGGSSRRDYGGGDDRYASR